MKVIYNIYYVNSISSWMLNELTKTYKMCGKTFSTQEELFEHAKEHKK
jgi:hypothetical protein